MGSMAHHIAAPWIRHGICKKIGVSIIMFLHLISNGFLKNVSGRTSARKKSLENSEESGWYVPDPPPEARLTADDAGWCLDFTT